MSEQRKSNWIGLTDEEGAEIWGDFYDIDYNRVRTPKEMFSRIEEKLRDKNRRQWIGLTDEEALACRGLDFFDTYRNIEAKLKEKNL